MDERAIFVDEFQDAALNPYAKLINMFSLKN
jgi:hypothetical protein